MTTTEKIDAALDSVLRAGGLWDSVKPDFIDRMREAMRKIMAESYLEGSHDAWDEMRRNVANGQPIDEAMKGK